MKKVSKYGIVLLSVAVLAATTSAATVAADVPVVESVDTLDTPQEGVSKVEVDYLIADHPGQLADTDHSTLSKGKTYNMTAPSSIGEYNFSYGAYWDDTMEIDGSIKYTTPSYSVEYKEGATIQRFNNFYTKKPNPQPQPDPAPQPQPEPQPDPKPTPQPSPNPTPTPTPQPKPEPEPQPDPKPAPQPGDNGKGDGKAENPADNQKPADKDAAKQPEGKKPTDNSKASDQNKKSETVKPKATEDKKEETKNKLPNTGEAVSSLGFLGVGLLSSLGLTKKRYKGRHERH
ncbi:LPXTG cell wall anchor domain-containing protein [Streptococcus sinensis]|uniref:LPXTG cell wall anchor domain-containing protein n=1 Tax=Streptococcus sinensis TaxID=176090 RepID=UPI00272BA5E9|nr:LPXTG cell wall anchor domain-containing protein [Streptococcus sinensis]